MANIPQGFKVALLASDGAIREAASVVLTACAYKVTPAPSVEECLQLCSVQRIDIVLAESSDLTVNKEKTLQLMASLKNVPLIVMSDADTPGTVFHGLKIGAVDFLKRPLDEAKVRSMWQHTLQKRMTAAPSVGDEGGGHTQRRLQPTLPSDPQGGGPSRGGAGFSGALSEGSSSEQRYCGQSTLESAPMTVRGPTPETAQNFASDPRPDPPSSSSQGQAGEQRKRTQRSTPESQRRKVRPTGSTTHVHSALGTSAGMTFPPLLGIPPGCVPPVGSNGLAIGMPFLNQHPFVPANPMNPLNTFGFVPPFMYGHGGDQDLMGGGPGSAFDLSGFGSLAVPTISPPAGTQTEAPVAVPMTGLPTLVTQPGAAPQLHRVGSTPLTVTPDAVSTSACSGRGKGRECVRSSCGGGWRD